MPQVRTDNALSKKVCSVLMVATTRNICPHRADFALLSHLCQARLNALWTSAPRTLGPMAGSTDWFRDSFRAEYEKQNAAIGRFNLAIFGKTGVGKSTLINAIFGEEVARTGIGEPVTKGSHLYLDKVGHLGIVDTQGLEVGKDNKQILSELDKAMTQMRQLPLSEQIHVAWYCIRGMDRRFEEAEADFIRRLDGMGLPVIVVLAQVPMRNGYLHPDAVLLAEQIIAKRLRLQDKELVEYVHKTTVENSYMKPYVPKDAKIVYDFAQLEIKKPITVKWDDTYDNGFVKELDASGFIDKLFQGVANVIREPTPYR